MSFNVKFGLNGKKHNSTYVMNFSGTDPILCDLMDRTDILNPAISLNLTIAENPTAWNYCYIEPFSRYYFINSWAWVDRLWVAYCSVDVLASWKSEILLTSPYVLRSYSTYNTNIIDTKYPEICSYTMLENHKANPFQPPANDYGLYAVAITNKSSYTGVSYYFFTYLGFFAFMQKLYTDGSYNFSAIQQAAADISSDLMKTLLNPTEYIVSIKWIPYSYADLTNRQFVTATNTVTLGWWNLSLTVQAYELNADRLDFSFTNKVYIAVPKHPLAQTRGAYMSTSHCKYILRFYPFGTFEIDPTILQGCNTLWMVTIFDIRSGHCILNLTTEEPTGDYSSGFKTNKCFKVVEAECCVNIPVASVTANPQQIGTSLLAGVASGIANGNFSGFGTRISNRFEQAGEAAVQAAQSGAGNLDILKQTAKAMFSGSTQDLSGIVSAGLAVSPSVDIIGQQGTFAGFPNQPLTLFCMARDVANEDLNDNGRPLCQIKTLGTLSGYVQTDQFSIEIAGALAPEIEEIENHYVSGFFIE